MESIGKLREFAEKAVYADNYIVGSTYDLNRIADEIEREISERYTLLPVDADGVPIRVGDVVQGLGDGGPVQHLELWDGSWVVVFEYSPGQFTRYSSDGVHHVKPRTVEDVLRDCCNEWNEHCGNDWERGVYAKYADELRGMGVGE